MQKKQSELNIESVHRLGHVAIRVEDVNRAKSFYMTLGMKLIWDDTDWCYLEAGDSKDGLALLGPSYKAAGPHFAFHFTDRAEVEEIHCQLKERGVGVGPGAVLLGARVIERHFTMDRTLKGPDHAASLEHVASTCW